MYTFFMEKYLRMKEICLFSQNVRFLDRLRRPRYLWNGTRKKGPRKNGPRKMIPQEKNPWIKNPRKMVSWKKGPRKNGPRKNGPQKNGPWKNVLQKFFYVKRMLGNLNDFFLLINYTTHTKIYLTFTSQSYKHRTVEH